LSKREIIHKNINKIGAVLLDLLKLHKSQTKLISPNNPEETKIVRKLELKVAPEWID